MNNTKIKLIIWIVIITFISLLYINALNSVKVKDNIIKQLSVRPKIQEIQVDLKQTMNEVTNLSNTIEWLKKDYENKIWKQRCLETLWELELKSMTWELDCTKDLEKFATYNLENTKSWLGL